MKKLCFTVAIVIVCSCSYAQTLNPTLKIDAVGAVNGFVGGYTFAYKTSGSPWNGALMSFGGFTNAYDCQISTDYGPEGGNHFSFRTHNGDVGTWNPWYEVWHNGNLNNSTTDFTARNMYASGNVGIGTASPNGKLDVNGSILLSGSTNNTMTRPVVGTARIAGEIASYSGDGLAYDDGLLRLSAGGGTTPLKSYIDLSGYSTVPDMDRNMIFGTRGTERVRINSSGNVGIGTTTPDSKLTVNGTIHSKEVKVDMNILPDYVFNRAYNLAPLTEVKAYIDEHHHLPEVPSAEQVAKDGLNLGEMNAILLKKVEELTLYLIEKDKQNEQKDTQLHSQQEQINQLKQQLAVIAKTLKKTNPYEKNALNLNNCGSKQCIFCPN